jgi:hypothetical protein
MTERRFAIRVDRWCLPLFVVLGIGPRFDHVDVDDATVTVRLGWMFFARVDRSAIVEVTRNRNAYGGWGAHGWRGRWLVNGSSKGIVRIELDPRQRGRLLMFWPVRPRRLLVSLDDPEGFIAAMGESGSAGAADATVRPGRP